MTTALPERLALIDTITLATGNHTKACPENGMCFVEFADWLTGGYGSDQADHISPVLRRHGIALNDRWDTERRQSLRPFGPRLIGTGGDGKDALREQLAGEFLVTRFIAPWYRLPGWDDLADRVEALSVSDKSDWRRTLSEVRDEAWKRRASARADLTAKIKAHLVEKHDAADAAYAAYAAADAAYAAYAAYAAADAAYAAYAAGAADAADAADAAGAAGASRWNAAYNAARAYYRESPPPVMATINDLAAKQQPLALELLEALIDPAVSA